MCTCEMVEGWRRLGMSTSENLRAKAVWVTDREELGSVIEGVSTMHRLAPSLARFPLLGRAVDGPGPSPHRERSRGTPPC